MPQLDLYIWSFHLLILVVFYFCFYIFILRIFLPRISKVLYLRKLLFSDLTNSVHAVEFKLALISNGIYSRFFVQSMSKYIKYIKLYFEVYKLALESRVFSLTLCLDDFYKLLFFSFFDYLVVVQRKSMFIRMLAIYFKELFELRFLETSLLEGVIKRTYNLGPFEYNSGINLIVPKRLV